MPIMAAPIMTKRLNRMSDARTTIGLLKFTDHSPLLYLLGSLFPDPPLFPPPAFGPASFALSLFGSSTTAISPLPAPPAAVRLHKMLYTMAGLIPFSRQKCNYSANAPREPPIL